MLSQQCQQRQQCWYACDRWLWQMISCDRWLWQMISDKSWRATAQISSGGIARLWWQWLYNTVSAPALHQHRMITVRIPHLRIALRRLEFGFLKLKIYFYEMFFDFRLIISTSGEKPCLKELSAGGTWRGKFVFYIGPTMCSHWCLWMRWMKMTMCSFHRRHNEHFIKILQTPHLPNWNGIARLNFSKIKSWVAHLP